MPYLRVKARFWHKNIWCRIFGHILNGYADGTPYGHKGSAYTDGTGTDHVPIRGLCRRCQETVTVINIHE